jgi:DNA-binding NarL/FixJ family response regulator
VQVRLAALIQKNGGAAIIVNTAKNALEMINSVKKLKPDVVILDIHIPGNGYNALQTIKSNNHTPVVIIYTHYFDAQIKRKCFSLGADYFFSKTVGFQKIRILLKQIIIDAECRQPHK